MYALRLKLADGLKRDTRQNKVRHPVLPALKSLN